MKPCFFSITSVFILCLFISCTPIAAYQSSPDEDRSPPLVLHCSATGTDLICIQCSESVDAVAETFSCDNGIGIIEVSVQGETLQIRTDEGLLPGNQYEITGLISDEAENSSLVRLKVYGWNPDPPRLLINEFTSKGSKRHPDRIELYALSAGNTAGIVIYDGTASDHRQKCILPAVDIKAGDYLIIHCTDPYKQMDAPYQFFMEDPVGLSGNNGVISVYTSVQGKIMDAVVYSNRFSDSDEDYRGFGSRVMLNKVQEMVSSGAWDSDIPEGAIRSKTTTATRSACRAYPPADTDSSADWHTVPTSGSSFGEENTNEVHEP